MQHLQVGAARRGQAQADLDIAQRKFLEERTFPEATLAQYSEFIQPTQRQLGAAGTRTNIGPGQAQPTYLQQASGFLGALSKFRKTGGKVGGSSGLASLQAGGQIPDEEDEPDPFTEEELAALAEAQPGFLETVGDTVSSGISSISDFLMERPKQDPFATPTRLDTLGDFLIGYSQADPSKPLGTQFGQAAASVSAKQAKERQKRIDNLLARQALKVKRSAAASKAGKLTPGILKELRQHAANEFGGMYDEKGQLVSADNKNPLDRKVAQTINTYASRLQGAYTDLLVKGYSEQQAYNAAINLKPITATPTVKPNSTPGTGTGTGAGARASGNPLSKYIPKKVSSS